MLKCGRSSSTALTSNWAKSCTKCTHRPLHRALASQRPPCLILPHLSSFHHRQQQSVLLKAPALSSLTARSLSSHSSWNPIFGSPSPDMQRSLVEANWIVLRSFHQSAHLQKEDVSKVEQTVKALKDQQKRAEIEKTESESGAQTLGELQPSIVEQKPVTTTTTAAEKSPTAAAVPDPAAEVAAVTKKTIWERTKSAVMHYYHGFRLLFIDTRVLIRNLWAVLNGRTLTRRERNQVVRTMADLFRIVPLLVFIVVPFMEFLLPVALKLFPNMLPSTFQEADKEREKRRKKLKSKLEMAKFLQDTIEELSVTKKGSTNEHVKEFSDFMKRIRTMGGQTSNKEIIQFSKLFEDEITLDNLTYGQLRALCNLLELPTAVGTNNFLRFQLRMKLRQLYADDRMIQKEGVDSLAVWEIQNACRARGMRALGLPENRLKEQLTQWLDLHLNEKIPTSLLLLSRAMYLPDTLSTEDQLKATISVLPDSTAKEAMVKISEVTGERMDNKAKLNVIKQEEEIIQQEKEEAKKTEEADRIRKAAKEAEDIPPIKDIAKEIQMDPAEVLVDKAPEIKEVEVHQVSQKDMEVIDDILGKVATDSLNQKELDDLKEDVNEYIENLEDLKEVVVATGGSEGDLQESKAAKRLSGVVGRMISDMDSITDRSYACVMDYVTFGEFTELHEKKEQLLEDIEVKEGFIKKQHQELGDEFDGQQATLDSISSKRQDLVDINKMLLMVEDITNASDIENLQKVARVLDLDGDGKIDISEAKKVVELLGHESVSISLTEIATLHKLLNKESLIEKTDKEEKKKEKQEKESLKTDGKTEGQ